jgi:hypothetical protein
MAFDILAWALGATLTAISKSILKRVFSDDLPSKLNKDVAQWANEISTEIQILPEAIFSEINKEVSSNKLPKLHTLREQFNKSYIPNKDIWCEALFEKWEYIKANISPKEAQEFFKIDAVTAKQYLHVLAEKLELTCKKDNELFKVTTINTIEETNAIVKDIQATLQQTKETAIATSNDPVQTAFRNEMSKVGDLLSQEQEEKLEKYRELYRQGSVKEAYNNILELYNSDSFNYLTNSVKAKILRILATYTLNVKGEIRIAEDHLNNAIKFDPSADYSVTLALIEYKKDKVDNALLKLATPTNLDAFNFKIALLFEKGDKDSFFAELKRLQDTISPNAETKRLKAFAILFFNKDISGALVEIESAMQEKPNWKSIQVAYGMINYFSALSPSVIPDQLIQFPEPPSLSYVKQDSVSIQRLEIASNQFLLLAESTDSGDPLKLSFLIWQLSCMANHPNLESEAKELAKTLLSEDPSDLRIISWIITRNFDIDLSTSLEVLKETGDDLIKHIDKVLSLLNIYIQLDEIPDGLKLLKKAQESFFEKNATDLWKYWYATVLIADKKYDEAIDTVHSVEHPEINVAIKTQALKAKSKETNEWAELLDHLENSFKDSKDAIFLIELCQIHSYLGNWSYVLAKSAELLSLLKTPVAVELAVKASWHEKDPKGCLNLIEKYCYLYFKGILPSDIYRIKVYCQIKLGTIPDALIDAEENYNNDNSTDNLLTLLEVQARVGDLKSLSVHARELLERDIIPLVPLLNIARLLIAENKTLAVKLWRKSLIQAEKDPDLIGDAVDIGYRLNLEREMTDLLDKMMKYANEGAGNVKLLHIDELRKLIQTKREKTGFIQEKYDKGEVPIHTILNQMDISLTRIYQVISQENSLDPNPHHQPIILSRHGGRQIDPDLSKFASDWRINLDTSALYMAQYLDILDEIEKCFLIRIPPSLQTSLIYEKEKLSFHQPSQIDTHNRIVALLNKGLLKELSDSNPDITHLGELTKKMGEDWVKKLETAKSEGSYLVDFSPLRSHDLRYELIDLTIPYKKHVVNCCSLLRMLYKKGKLAKSTYKAILADLGVDGNEKPMGSLPPLNSKIIITGGVLNMLAATEALNVISQNYEVCILQKDIKESNNFLKETESRQTLINNIDSLLERITEGLKSGLYSMIPLQDEQVEPDDDQNPVLSSLLDLFKGSYERGDIVWIDDRFCNSYQRINIAPIVGINEILHALYEIDILNDDQYYEKLLKLRSSNFRYIPLSKAEIVYYLQKANINNGQVNETYELRTLKRYLASCLLDFNRLQIPHRPSGTPNPDGELLFVLSSLRAISESISYWWEQNYDDEHASAYAHWIYINLYTGSFGIRHLRSDSDPKSDGLDLLALDIATAFMRGVSFLGKSQSIQRSKYFNWIENILLIKRLRLNPEIAGAISKLMTSLFQNEYLESIDEELKTTTILLLQDFYLSLPTSLQSSLELSKEAISAIKVKTTESTNIQGHNFSTDSFCLAINKAINGDSSLLKDLQSGIEFNVSHQSDEIEGSYFEIDQIDNALSVKLIDPVLYVLSSDIQERKNILFSNKNWFDINEEDMKHAIDDIVATDNLLERIKKVEFWKKSSASIFYDRLEHQVVSSHSFKYDELLPSPSGLIRHYRLDLSNDNCFEDKLNTSAQQLFDSEGLEMTINRLSKLPTELPYCVINKFEALADEEQNEMLGKYKDTWASPVCKIHLVSLSLIANNIELAKEIIDDLFSEKAGHEFEQFKAILKWLNQEFENITEFNDWEPSIKIAILWVHTSYLQNIFHVGQADPKEMTELFLSRSMPSVKEIFQRNPLKWNDILHPNRINRIMMLIGLAKTLSVYDPNVINALGIEAKLSEYALDKSDIKIDFLLFTDPLLMSDSLNSLFGGDRSMNLPFLEHNIARELSSIYLKNTVRSILKRLKTAPGGYFDWLKLSLILGDLPCYGDLQNDLKLLILDTDFNTYFDQDHLAALVAIHVGSKQARYLQSHEAISHIEDGLLKVATYFFNHIDAELGHFTIEQIAVGLIDDALSLSIAVENSKDISEQFCRIAQLLFERWPLTADYMRSGIFRLTQELPANLLHGFWKLNLFLRAN